MTAGVATTAALTAAGVPGTVEPPGPGAKGAMGRVQHGIGANRSASSGNDRIRMALGRNLGTESAEGATDPSGGVKRMTAFKTSGPRRDRSMAASPGVIAGGIEPAGIPGTSGTTVTGTTAPLIQGPEAHPAPVFGARQRGIEGPGAPTTGVPKMEMPGH